MTQEIFAAAIEAILQGDVEKAAEAARRGLDARIDPLELMANGFIPESTRSVIFSAPASCLFRGW